MGQLENRGTAIDAVKIIAKPPRGANTFDGGTLRSPGESEFGCRHRCSPDILRKERFPIVLRRVAGQVGCTSTMSLRRPSRQKFRSSGAVIEVADISCDAYAGRPCESAIHSCAISFCFVHGSTATKRKRVGYCRQNRASPSLDKARRPRRRRTGPTIFRAPTESIANRCPFVHRRQSLSKVVLVHGQRHDVATAVEGDCPRGL